MNNPELLDAGFASAGRRSSGGGVSRDIDAYQAPDDDLDTNRNFIRDVYGCNIESHTYRTRHVSYSGDAYNRLR